MLRKYDTETMVALFVAVTDAGVSALDLQFYCVHWEGGGSKQVSAQGKMMLTQILVTFSTLFSFRASV